MKVLAISFLICGLLLTVASGQDYEPGQLYVIFKPNRVALCQDSTGFTSCGIGYIDSINYTHNCSAFINAGCDACECMQNDYLVVFPESTDVPALAEDYMADTNVIWAGPNALYSAAFTPNDPYFSRPSPTSTPSAYQWPFDSTHLQMEKAWDITKGNPNVVVAVMEFALAWRHPDLQRNMWINSGEDIRSVGVFDTLHYPQYASGDIDTIDNDGDGYADNVIGYSFYQLPGNPSDTLDTVITIVCNPNPEPRGIAYETVSDAIHGARVWSNLGAATNDTIGVAGAGFQCRVMPVAFNAFNITTFNNALCFLVRMRESHGVPHVVNISYTLGGQTLAADYRCVDLLDSLSKLGVVIVAAIGNTGEEKIGYPANHLKVVGVAATDSNDYRAGFSSYHSLVDLSAPGFNYMATHDYSNTQKRPLNYRYASIDSTGQPTLIRGTSFASPQVAGVAALIRTLYPSWSDSEVIAKLRSSTDTIHFKPGPTAQQESTIIAQGKLGTGRLNAFKALTFFGNIPGEFASDTTLHDTVYVSGDITVRNGKTLRLAAGTVLRFYPGDVMRAGVDTTKTEIVVESGGKLIIGNPPGSPVKLVSFRRELAPYDSTTTNDWQGIVVRPGGYISVNNAIIRHAYIGIEDSSKYSHTIQNVRVGRCKMYGIYAVSTDSLTIRGCRVDSVNSSPGGAGFSVVSATSIGARVVRDTARACWYGIEINFSATPVESCRVEAATGTLTSNTGIYNYDQGYLTGYPNLSVKATEINGYFTNEHFHNSIRGRVQITDGCSFASSTGTRSPNGIRNTAGDYLKLRKSKVMQWGGYGVLCDHTAGHITDLGSVANPADSGFNIIYTSASGTGWKYVYDQSSGSVIKAEWNCWGALNPSSTRFSSNIDRSPWDISCMEAPPKIAADEGGTELLPKPTDLFQNYPNPFNPTTLIQFNLEKTEKVNLEVFNILGQKVRTILSGEGFAAGPYTFLWDGRDDRGGAVSSGMYIYRLQTPTYLRTKKMMLVK